ncbi:MAG TPA: alpha-amylase family glycosyl hydrolase [Rubricoccaceae bacterium]|jgi:glycosidase
MLAPSARPWWQTGVLYHVYPRSFQDSDGDGSGDLDGITSRLGYVAALGADAIWISPFYPSPQADGGYDVADYCDVDPLCGDLAAFDRLVVRAHGLGLRVVVDWVPNHASDQHPWFRESRASRESLRRDWFVWRDAAPDGGPPNNWLSAFGGPAWTWDAATAQFYLHSFLKEQPDTNWRDAGLRDALLATLRFWMDSGVDGFRIDTAVHIAKDPLFRDNPPEPAPDAGHKPVTDYERQQHLHDRFHPDAHGYFQTFRRLVDTHPDPSGARPERALFGEIHLARDLPAWGTTFGTPEAPELHLPLNFGLLAAPWTARGLRAHVEAIEAAVPGHAWPSYVLGSHDERRLVARVGPAGARLAAVLLLTLRGTPTLYAGDEIGTPDVDVPPDRIRDPAGLRVPGTGRDSGRTPMAWDASPSAGFSEAPPDALWLPLHAGHETLNVAAQLADPGSLLALYRRLLALRRATPALHSGAYHTLRDVPEAVFSYERTADAGTADESRAVVLLNLGDAEAAADLPGGTWAVAVSTHDAGAKAPGAVSGQIRLRPGEGVVLTPRRGRSASAGPTGR